MSRLTFKPWMIALGLAGGYVIYKMTRGESLIPGLSSESTKGPACGPGLYASYNQTGFWSVFDGEAKAEQLRIQKKDCTGYKVAIDGDSIIVTWPSGLSTRIPRRRSSSNLAPPTVK